MTSFDPWEMPIPPAFDSLDAIDEAELRRGLAVLLAPAHYHMFQALPSARWSYASGSDMDAVLSTIRGLGGGKGLYFSLNAIDQPLAHPLRSSDVPTRRWFLIDVDVIRDGECSATQTERDEAGFVAANVDGWLGQRGWSAPVVVDSGNGWHLLYRLDLPADRIVQTILRQCLAALGERFDTAEARVDRATHDARRVSKLPGTWVRKGPDTPDRPHRLARLVSVPDRLEVVTLEQVQALAGLVKSKAEPRPEPRPFDPFQMLIPGRNGTGSRDLTRYLARALECEVNRVVMAPQGERNNALNRAAFSLGGLAGLGLDANTIQARLLDAARQCGLGEREALTTISSGLAAGLENPRKPPEDRRPDANGPAKEKPHGIPPSRLFIWAKDVTPKKSDWLWRGRLPLGKMTTFAGQGGLGKTFTLCDIAARVSQGAEWPFSNGEPAPRGRTLFISAEDDIDDTLVPRLMDLGADLSQIAFLSPESEGVFNLSEPGLMDDIVQAMTGVNLVVIDPPTSYLQGVDDHKNVELRSVLAPLKRWCSEQKIALIFNNHVNKSTGPNINAAERVMGSVAWVNGVRAAHLFMRDIDNPENVTFTPIKINGAKRLKGLSYTIEGLPDDRAEFRWLGEVDLTSDEAARGERRKPRGMLAAEFIEGLFRQKPVWPALELVAMCQQAGISRNARLEASERLPIANRQAHDERGERFVEWYSQNPDWPST